MAEHVALVAGTMTAGGLLGGLVLARWAWIAFQLVRIRRGLERAAVMADRLRRAE